MKGTLAIFIEHISKSKKIIVLSSLPPHKLYSFRLTNYQAIEEPILKGGLRGGAVLYIEIVYLTVKGAKNFYYHVWPVNKTHT